MATIVVPVRKVSLFVLPRITAIRVVLSFVCLIATVNALTGRGAFFDEAIYQMAGRLLLRGEDWNFTTWFVGSPFGYPILVGVLDRLGFASIEAARLVNIPFLLLSVLMVYKIGHEMGIEETEAAFGAGLYGFAGAVLFTGSFATYDISAFAFALTATYFVLKGTRRRRIYVLPLLAAGVMLGIAIFLKYVVVAIAPFIAGIIFVRLIPLKRTWVPRMILWLIILPFVIPLAGIIVVMPAAVILGFYVSRFHWQLELVFRYSGGHTTNYGATDWSVLFEIFIFLTPAWLLAIDGLFRLWERSKSLFLVGLVLFGGSFLMVLYHLLRVDPLALFKQICLSYALLGPLMGVSLAGISSHTRPFRLVLVGLVLVSGYHLWVLRGFYPENRDAISYLQATVRPEDDPILVDNAWPYRYGLADTFRGREWWVVDQWWWRNTLATPELWRNLIQQRAFSRVVLEEGGAFNGKGSVLDDSVVRTLEESANYRREARFPSKVTWGNSILPPPFEGELEANSIVWTQIWVRKE